ncbi:hypothetical protein [Azospirillum sp. ST 5-10]|uniref:hypothetical protein n=1 Tax=unclassified Azospirillum TaxID=2630922 RepID=UPI003F4A0C10
MDADTCFRLIGEALPYGGHTHTVDDVVSAVAEGRMQMWQSDRSLLVTELRRYPQLLAVRIVLGAGDLADIWENLEPRVEAFAREMGATRIEAVGRMGWLRAAAPHGYGMPRVCMHRDLA